MRSGVRTPSGPLIAKHLRPGNQPGLLSVTTFVHPATLIHSCVRLFRPLLGLHLRNLDFVIPLETRKCVLQSLRRGMDVFLRHNDSGVASDPLNAERICVGLSEAGEERMTAVIEPER